MKLQKIALVGVISLAAVVATSGIAGAANGTKAINKTYQFRTAQAQNQMAGEDQAKHSERGNELKCFSALSTAAQLLGLKPEELKAELKAGKNLKDVASAKGLDIAKFAQDLEAALTAKIDQAVQNGKLTSEQATTYKARIPQRVQALLARKWDGQKGHGFQGGARGGFKGITEPVQILLGIDAATLKAELTSGKSLADIAQAKGISKDTLIAKIQATLVARLDQAVQDQKITAEEAAKIKGNLPQKIESMVTRQHVQKQPEAKADQTKTT